MITLHYGDREKQPYPILEQIPGVFRIQYIPRWMDNPLSVELTEAIERVKVESPYCLRHYAYGQISPYMMSAGVQHLLIMLNCKELRDKYMFDCAYFGDNCVPYIQKIGEQVNLHIFVERYLDWDTSYMKAHPVKSAFSNKLLYSYEEVMDDQNDFLLIDFPWEEYV